MESMKNVKWTIAVLAVITAGTIIILFLRGKYTGSSLQSGTGGKTGAGPDSD